MSKENFLENIPSIYSLRQATADDVEFVFNVSTEAMRPVVDSLNPGKTFDSDAEFKIYQEKFLPEEIEIIQSQGIDVGRLRIVRSTESIYIGGIQIFPELQNRGIGTAILADLIQESNRAGVPILLEVHEVNTKALIFYKGLGFVELESKEGKLSMEYRPE